MCVIIEFSDNKPEEITKELLSNAESHNKHGGGIAWIEGDVVKWEKGMHVTAEYIDTLIKEKNIQQPFVVHFRIATHGAIDTPLCHPFALSPEVDELSSSGSDPIGVLFHNGVWSDYRAMALKTLTSRTDAKIPDGDISDSRIMAWLVRYYGISYLGFIQEKGSVLTPKGLIEFGSGWTDVKNVRCSNSNFENTYSGNFGNWKSNVNNHGTVTSYYKDSKSEVEKDMDMEDDEDFRLELVKTALQVDLEAENQRRRSINEKPISEEDFEVLCDSEYDMMNLVPVGKQGFENKLLKMKEKLEQITYITDDEYFDEELGTGYIDGAGIFHPYGFNNGGT